MGAAPPNPVSTVMLFCAAMSVVHTLPGEDRVVGLAMLNGELYVLRQSTQNQISVYSAAADSTSTTEHYLLRQFSVAGLASNCNNDLTASARTNCLYVSDWRNKRLLKSGTDGLVETRWGLPYNPYAMSLTPNDKLLITSWDSRKLLEISGKRFRKMDLQSDLDKLCHAVQLTSQIFVVSHGRWDNYENLHRVCLVGQDGKVLLSYGHLSGSDGLHLDLPRHLAVDRDNFVIVADYYNSRLAVLSPSLQLVRHVPLPSKPWRLYLDHVTRRLYVGYYDAGDVSVIQV